MNDILIEIRINFRFTNKNFEMKNKNFIRKLQKKNLDIYKNSFIFSFEHQEISKYSNVFFIIENFEKKISIFVKSTISHSKSKKQTKFFTYK